MKYKIIGPKAGSVSVIGATQKLIRREEDVELISPSDDYEPVY